MNEQDWDEFAEDYYLNQVESQSPIVEDVLTYLTNESVLPTNRVADVAGGTGRYLKMAREVKAYELIDFSKEMLKFAEKEAKKTGLANIRFTKQSFSDFLENEETYDLLFSAANPALDEPIKLEKMLAKATQACVILRVVCSRDDVFTPLEKQLGILEEDLNTTPWQMDQFETYLKDRKLSYAKKDFTYYLKEEISLSFMKEYYEEYLDDQQLLNYLNQRFMQNEQVISTTELTYRLLLIK